MKIQKAVGKTDRKRMEFKPKSCGICHCDFIPRSGRAMYCDDCRGEFNILIEDRDTGDRRMYDPIKRSRAYERIKADPERYAAHLAAARIAMKKRREKRRKRPVTPE